MLDAIEKLLVLQDRDRKIMRVKDQLARVEPERQMLQTNASQAQAGLEAARAQVNQIESQRKKLELDAEAKRQLIEKYALQQFQTKKNEEYRALAHEIDTCKLGIQQLEDQQIELMEQAEGAQKNLSLALREAEVAKKASEAKLNDLAGREKNLRDELAGLESNRDQLAAGIDESSLARYQRLLKQKGDNVVVGVYHGVCAGCHMRFPAQLMVTCRAQQELVSCPNCGRLLYYTKDMDLTVVD